MPQVLGVEVAPKLVRSWARWLAPDPQPFLVEPDGRWRGTKGGDGTVTRELRDTYRLWGVARGLRLLWLSEREFRALPKEERAALVREQIVHRRGAVPTVRAWVDHLDGAELRAQADGHRFVWWRSLLGTDPLDVLRRVVAEDRLASRHGEVPVSTWRGCEDVLPRARDLAGTFPSGSSACCFSAVMGAAGADVKGACDSVDPFTEWLTTSCTRGGDSKRPGTVLVWRTHEGVPVHAAVTIGDGWALEKPSQEWHSPTGIAGVDDVVRTSRYPGQRLERHTIL